MCILFVSIFEQFCIYETVRLALVVIGDGIPIYFVSNSPQSLIALCGNTRRRPTGIIEINRFRGLVVSKSGRIGSRKIKDSALVHSILRYKTISRCVWHPIVGTGILHWRVHCIFVGIHHQRADPGQIQNKNNKRYNDHRKFEEIQGYSPQDEENNSKENDYHNNQFKNLHCILFSLIFFILSSLFLTIIIMPKLRKTLIKESLNIY